MKRFWDKVNKTNNCWLWQGALTKKSRSGVGGYGVFFLDGKTTYTHRFIYESFKGIIKKGYVIDHLCRDRGCVNPDHLEAVTTQENIKRGTSGEFNKSKTKCPKGHDYASGNVLLYNNAWRICKTCNNERSRQRRIKVKGKI
jgi:HNH endonuclease